MSDDAVGEREAFCVSGWLFLMFWLAGVAWTAWAFYSSLNAYMGPRPPLLSFLTVPLLVLLARGFLVLQPNQAAVLTFFGRYTGSLRDDGFFWVNPFSARGKVSLRVHNLTTPTLKVNDRSGNPVEVAAVVVWRVADTARAIFDVENFESFIAIQSESALRQVVSARWYDGDVHGQNSLRGDLETVVKVLAEALQEHVALAGLEIVEARISHLAYAPEIAGAMLRRQQAEAVVAARSRIVEGAVGMLKMAIEELQSQGVVTLSDSERVRLVSNLMTVLVSEGDAQPVLPVGHSGA